MGVDLRRRHVLVAEQFLHGADVMASFEQMRGERMAQRVAGGRLVDRRQLPRRAHGALQPAVVDMMPPQLPRTRIDRALRREEHVLRSEAHKSELQSLMRKSYAAFCFTNKQQQ